MSEKPSQKSNNTCLAGLDGGNMLAFLAALGTLRTLSEVAHVPVRLSWSPTGGSWRPVLHVPTALQPSHVVDILSDAFAASRSQPEAHSCMLWKHWDGQSAGRRDIFDRARRAANGHDRAMCDWLGAIGSDLLQSAGEASDTPLRASRADYLLGNLRTILADTSDVHLRKALFAAWTYDDPLDNCSLKFDPSEDRRHALQWSAPTKDRDRKKRGNMLGANRLAIEGLPLFTSVISAGRLGTVACDRPADDWRISWCLWNDPASLDTVRSLLDFGELLEDSPRPTIIREFGLCAVFRCHRQTIGKTRIFTPARRVA